MLHLILVHLLKSIDHCVLHTINKIALKNEYQKDLLFNLYFCLGAMNSIIFNSLVILVTLVIGLEIDMTHVTR